MFLQTGVITVTTTYLLLKAQRMAVTKTEF